MDRRFDWTIRIGHWRSVTVRLHLALVLVALIGLVWCYSGVVVAATGGIIGGAALTLGVLALSVTAHEMGHLVATWRWNSAARDVVLAPFSQAPPDVIRSEPARLFVWAIAGPATNMVLMILGLAALALQAPEQDWLALLQPLRPAWDVSDEITVTLALKTAVWINWLLVLLNCLPAYPFDAACGVHGLLRWGFPNAAPHRLGDVQLLIAISTAAAVLVGAAVVGRANTDTVLPSWWGLIAIGMVMIVASVRALRWQDTEDMIPPRYEMPTLIVSQEPRALVRTIDAPRLDTQEWPVANEHVADIEQQDDSMLDDLLRRVHDHGLDSLSSDQRQVLDRISRRFRERRDRSQ